MFLIRICNNDQLQIISSNKNVRLYSAMQNLQLFVSRFIILYFKIYTKFPILMSFFLSNAICLQFRYQFCNNTFINFIIIKKHPFLKYLESNGVKNLELQRTLRCFIDIPNQQRCNVAPCFIDSASGITYGDFSGLDKI